MEFINVQTGEILNFESMTDEEIVNQLETLEDLAMQAKSALDGAKQTLISRMIADGAKLRLTEKAKVRLLVQSRPSDQKLIEKLYEECPEQLKSRCFKFEVKPIKSGLNELAKLGEEWRRKVDACYKTSTSLKIEWVNRQDNGVDETEIEDCPF